MLVELYASVHSDPNKPPFKIPRPYTSAPGNGEVHIPTKGKSISEIAALMKRGPDVERSDA